MNANIMKNNRFLLCLITLAISLFLSNTIIFTFSNASENSLDQIQTHNIFGSNRLELWSCQIDAVESSQPPQTDYVIIKENTNSNDGPPYDSYDVEDPPIGPNQNLNAYLNDNLLPPKDKLIVDSRYGPDDDFYKIFNLTVSWLFNPIPTQVTLSWNSQDINFSEYRFVNLTDNAFSFLTDMKNNSNYSFTAAAFSYNNFHIVCEKQAPPDAGVNTIISPSETIPINGPSDVSVNVKNYCVQNINDVHVNCMILDENSTIVYNDNQTINLTPLGDTIAYFTDWIPQSQGDFSIYSCVNIMNDSNSLNDCANGSVNVNILPVSNFSYDPINPRTDDVINFTDLSFDSNGFISNWTWDFGDGTFAYSPNVTHMFSENDEYIVCLTVTDNDGFSHTNCENIQVLSAIPSASFTFSPLTPSTYDTINFTDTSSDYDGVIVNWTWDFGDGTLSYQQNPTHLYEENQIYSVQLTIIDDDGETNLTSQQISITNSPPSANFSYDPSNPSIVDIVNFTDLSNDIDGIIVNWSWDFGDGNTSYSPNTSHQYLTIGEYTVILIVEDDDGAQGSFSTVVNVTNSPPLANFTFSPFNPKTFDTIQFSDYSLDYDGFIVSWYWDFGDENDSSSQTPSHQYDDDGDYLVCLTVEDNLGGINTSCQTITVINREPTANFTFSPPFPNQSDTITFTDLSTDPDGNIDSWTWDFDDGNTSILENPTYQYSSSGLYQVTLTVTDDDGGTSTISKLVPYATDLAFVGNLSIGWNFISVPFNNSLAKNDLFIKYNGYLYEFTEGIVSNFLFGWDRSGQFYSFSEHLNPGYGYWLFSYENCELCILNTTLLFDQYITTLKPGWNMVGIPSNQQLHKTDLIFDDIDWNTAVGNGWVNNFIFGWNQIGQYYEFSNILYPSKSYWIFSFQTGSLKQAI